MRFKDRCSGICPLIPGPKVEVDGEGLFGQKILSRRVGDLKVTAVEPSDWRKNVLPVKACEKLGEMLARSGKSRRDLYEAVDCSIYGDVSVLVEVVEGKKRK